MRHSAAADGRVEFSNDAPQASGSIGLQATSMVLFGLAAPVILFSLVDPNLLRHGKLVVLALLMPALFVAVGVYVYSVLVPGDVASIVVDPQLRQIELSRNGSFAIRSEIIPFDEVERVLLARHYDDDGYGVVEGQLRLRSGATIAISGFSSEDTIKALARAIGVRADS
ncbi:MAG TPA: hypothetical protein PK264_19890 [Hyphomicrobiaceae bacterium]|nr:hypothetical protein [Hyphomicrobiaceae bacterium]